MKTKQTKTIKLILACLTIIALVNADCPISYYPRQTTIGYIKADIDSNSHNSNQQQIYQYPLVSQLQSTSLSRTVVAVNGYSIDKKSQEFGFKVQVSFPKNPAISVAFTVTTISDRNIDKWKYIQFSFIVSESAELSMGTKNVLQLSPSQSPNNFKVIDQINLPSNNYNYKPSAKVFISGFLIKQKSSLTSQNKAKIDDNINKIQMLKNFAWNQGLIKKFLSIVSSSKATSLSLTQASVNQNGQLSFSILTSQMQLKALTYSYIVYFQRLNSQPLYQIAQGSFILGDQDTYSYNTLLHDDMKIVGISGLKYSSDQAGLLSFQTRTGQSRGKKFYIGFIEANYAQFNMEYFSISVPPGSSCSNCPGSPLIYEQFCVSQCPYGYVSSINSDGQYFCHQCNVQGFLVAQEDQRKCVCATGHYLVSPTQSCMRCPYDCLTCNGNTCLTCDTQNPVSFRILNTRTGRCQCPAFDPNGIGLYDDINSQQRSCVKCNSRCKTCKGPSITDCITCQSSRVLNNGLCKCVDNLIETNNGQCSCVSPYVLNQFRQCVISGNSCRQNQTLIALQNGQKYCNCKPGYVRNIISNICQKECQSYEQFNYQKSSCQCRAGHVRNQNNQICYPCSSKLNQIYNDYTKLCECMSGFQLNKSGQCSSCPPKSYYNNKNDSCDCIYNFYRSYPNGPCIKCANSWDSPDCSRFNNLGGLQM